MLYQIGLILILVVVALIVGKKLKKTNKTNEQLVFEDDMTEEELKKLDDEIN
jgi:cell division protein FtsB